MRFSHIKYALITELTFGPYPDVDMDRHRLKDLYFGSKLASSPDDIDNAIYALEFIAIDDMDVMKVTLYYMLKHVVIRQAGRYLADLFLRNHLK